VVEHPPVVAVPAPQPVVEREGLARAHRRAVRLDCQRAVVGVHAVRPALAQVLLRSAPRQLEPAPVEIGSAAVGAGQPDHQGSGVGEQTEPVLAFARRRFGSISRQRAGEHLGQEAEPRDQLVGPVPLGAERAEGERAGDGALDGQRDGDERLSAAGGQVLTVGPGRARELVEPGQADDVAVQQARGDPGVSSAREGSQERIDAVSGPRMGGPDDVVVRLPQLGEHRAIEVELVHDTLERPLDVLGDVPRRDERRREIRHEGLEAESLGELTLGATALGPVDEQTNDETGLHDERNGSTDDVPRLQVPHRALALDGTRRGGRARVGSARAHVLGARAWSECGTGSDRHQRREYRDGRPEEAWHPGRI